MTENPVNEETLNEEKSDTVIKNNKSENIVDYLSSDILDIKTYTLDESNNLNNDNEDFGKFDENLYDSNISDVNEKQVTKGIVVSVNERGVLVDIGFKSEGIIDKNEFKKLPKVGDEIDTFIVCFEDRKGRLILSKEKADFEKRWEELRSAYSEETLISGFVSKRIKGGMVVDLGVVNAFLPGSQIDIKTVTNFDEYVGNEYEFKIVKFNEFRQNIVVSRKATLSDSEGRQEMLDNIEVGSTVEGVVKNITDFGAFIDLGGIDGLLHITDITWGRINHPKEKLDIGNKINVMIIDYDKEKHRISLGLKQLSKDPWMNIQNKYSEDTNVSGKNVNIMNYGIFVELEEGIEGLVHISEISWTKHIKHPSDIYKVGDKIDAVILSVDISDKKISLGIKQLSDNPWTSIEDHYKVDDICKGIVSNIVQNGAFIQIENNMEGFLHNNDISWTRKIKSANSILEANQEVEVKILEINVENKKINFGMKQLTDDVWFNIDDYFKLNDTIDGEVIYILEKGIILLLPNDFEGIIPISKISDINKYKIGEKLSVMISEINKDSKKISLIDSSLNNIQKEDVGNIENVDESVEDK